MKSFTGAPESRSAARTECHEKTDRRDATFRAVIVPTAPLNFHALAQLARIVALLALLRWANRQLAAANPNVIEVRSPISAKDRRGLLAGSTPGRTMPPLMALSGLN
jgi:hypothetical protein